MTDITTIRPKDSRKARDLYTTGIESYTSAQAEILSDIAIKLNLNELTNDSLDEIVQLIGEYMEVSRTVVGKRSKDGETFSIISEWASDGTPLIKEALQNVRYDEIPTFSENLFGKGIWYFSDRNELPDEIRIIEEEANTYAALALPLYVNSKPWGAIAHDVCDGPRIWSTEDIHMLMTVSHLIGLALRDSPLNTA